MNIIKVQQTFKRLPDEKVAEYVRDPALGFIALMELNERKKERDAYQAQSQQPDVSLAESIPQELGIMSGAAPSAPPPTMPAIQPQPMEQPMEQPVGMAGGGIVAFSNGGDAEEERKKQVAQDRAAISQFGGDINAIVGDLMSLPERAGTAGINMLLRPVRALFDNPNIALPDLRPEEKGVLPQTAARTRARLEQEKPPSIDEYNVTGGAGTQTVATKPPVRTTTPGGPTPARPSAPAGLAAISGVPAVQSLEQMINAAKTGGEKIGKIFPDQVSPLMEEYQKYLQGKKVSEDEARREGFRQFGLKALQGTSRDFFQNIGAAGEAGMGAYKAIQEKNSQIQDTIMQQKITLAQAKEARDRGNFDLAMRLNDKAQALGLQRYGLEVERAKTLDAMETNKVQREAARAQMSLIPAKLKALEAQVSGANKRIVTPETYQRAYAALGESYRNKLKSQIEKQLAQEKGSAVLQTEEGMKKVNAILNTMMKSAVLQSLGLPPDTEVGSSYVNRPREID